MAAATIGDFTVLAFVSKVNFGSDSCIYQRKLKKRIVGTLVPIRINRQTETYLEQGTPWLGCIGNNNFIFVHEAVSIERFATIFLRQIIEYS